MNNNLNKIMNRRESNRPTEDRASQRYGYLSRCWELNSIVNSETTEKFIDIVYTRCALEDKTIILVESASRRDVVILRCYFSKQRATSDFPSIGFAELCQFRMLWKIDRTNTDAFSYVLTELNDFHSHQKFSEDQIQYETKLQRIPAHMQKRAIDYFSNNFSANSIYNVLRLEFTTDMVPFSFDKLKNFLDYHHQKSKESFSFESIVEANNDDGNTIIKIDNENERLFMTTKERIYLWNNLKDVLL